MGKIVTKFGGSSLSDASQFQKVKSILDMDKRRCYVVPSAPGRRFDGDDKITDLLYKCYRMHKNGEDIRPVFKVIRERFCGIKEDLGLEIEIEEYLDEVERDILADASADYCASRGEYLNGLLLADYLGWTFLDAKDYIFFREDGTFDSECTNAVLTERLQSIGDRRRARSKCQCRNTPFKGCNTLFKDILCGVGESAVDVARIGKTETSRRMSGIAEHVRCGSVDRYGTRICCGIGLFLTHMKLKRFKFIVVRHNGYFLSYINV